MIMRSRLSWAGPFQSVSTIIFSLILSVGLAASQARATLAKQDSKFRSPSLSQSARPHSPHVEVSLISEALSVGPGQKFLAGLEFKIDAGWHVYWQNPGDFGQPVRLLWPDTAMSNAQQIAKNGFVADVIQWPLPHRIQTGTIVSYGYVDQVLLPFAVEVASAQTLAKRSDSGAIDLNPKVKWLVCADVCIPGEATLELRLPILKSAFGQAIHLANKKKFDQAHAQLPLYQPAQAHLSGTLNSERFVLQIEGLQLDRANLEILPAKNGLIDYLAPVEVHANGSVIEVSLKRSDRLTANVEHFPAVIKSANQAYAVDFPIRVEMKQATSSGVQARNQMSTANSVLAHSEASADFSNVVLPVLFAFLGGLLLNLMPCVFPVLSIKVMGLLKMSGQSRSQVLINGWSYTVGILVSFWLLVAALLFLRVGGRQIGWGFQLQSPQFVFSLACFLFIFSLNLMGLFELSGRFLGRVTTAGDSLTRRSGWVGSFFTGVLATLVATPCSAPFMGSAVGFAISQPPSVIFIIFTSLGLGLALPYLLICYVPWFAKVLPRPGAWMHTFQELMAFALLATVVWLVWVLSFQVASSGLVVLFLTFTALSFLVWLYRRFEKLAWLSLGLGVAIVVLASRTLTIADLHQRLSETTVQKGDLVWQKFAPEKIAQYQAAGRPVFIDFTAAWCVSCQVNEALIFHSEAVTSKIKQMNFVLMKADWTNEDPVITQALHAFGRDGVPYYVIYPKGSGAALVALPEVLNASIVLDALEKLPL